MVQLLNGWVAVNGVVVMMIQVRNVSHLSGERALREAYQSAKGGRFLSDAGAVTIAAMWQSPGRVGAQLAAFASGMAVSAEDLLADIDKSLPEAETKIDRTGLEELRRWVLQRDSAENVTDARKAMREIRGSLG